MGMRMSLKGGGNTITRRGCKNASNWAEKGKRTGQGWKIEKKRENQL